MTGKIALVARGTCTFEIKKNNAVAAGATALIVHNNSPDPPSAMAFATAAPPSVMITLADGRALVAWAAGNPARPSTIAGPLQRLTSGWPDVVAGSSSRGPALTMGIKPDIAAPGYERPLVGGQRHHRRGQPGRASSTRSAARRWRRRTSRRSPR